MPELPEVESYALALNPLLRGLVLRGARPIWPKVAARPGPDEFGEAVAGRTIESVTRRAKYLLFRLDRGALLIHLRMTGRLSLAPATEPDPRHLTLALGLEAPAGLDPFPGMPEGPLELQLVDYRKFGRAWVVADSKEVVGDLGPEPLARHFTAARLAGLLKGRRGRLKPLLLNQRFVAGIGNIYADEALFRARLHPLAPADTLDRAQTKALHSAIRSVLREAIDHGGTTFLSFVGPHGTPGRYRERLRVFGRPGQPCLRRGCSGTIQRILVGQRSTHFCSVCQPKPR